MFYGARLAAEGQPLSRLLQPLGLGSARSWNFQAGHLCNPDKNGASILEAESAVREGLASVPSTAATSVYGHRFLCRVAELVS